MAGQCEGGFEHSCWAQSLENVTSQVSIVRRKEKKTERRKKRGKKGAKVEGEQEEGLLLTQ